MLFCTFNFRIFMHAPPPNQYRHSFQENEWSRSIIQESAPPRINQSTDYVLSDKYFFNTSIDDNNVDPFFKPY